MNTDTQGFGPLNKHGRQRNDEGRGMVRVKQCLGLDNQHRLPPRESRTRA